MSGTSISGYGKGESSIIKLDKPKSMNVEQNILDKWIMGTERFYNGKKVVMNSFTL